MSSQKKISIVNDFSRCPTSRFRNQGPKSGEAFREDFLLKALQEYDQVVINVDDTEGYGSSFLEEAFGGLVREKYFSIKELEKKLTIESNNPAFSQYIDVIWAYIKAGEKST